MAMTAALLVASCGGGGGSGSSSSSNAVASRPVEQSDQQIATAIYIGSARTPAGFYAESPPSGHALVATTHLKNTDVDTSLDSTQAQFELCTDDWNEALTWSEASARATPQYANLVATNDDARFFEFARVQSGEPEVYLQTRVYKCAYLDRASANLRVANGAAGKLNFRPIIASELQRISEYLWQFTSYNNFGSVVLNSIGANGTTLSHTLHIAKLVRGGVSPSCDRIDVIAWKHSVDAATGTLTLTAQTSFSFGARENAGIAELCSS